MIKKNSIDAKHKKIRIKDIAKTLKEDVEEL